LPLSRSFLIIFGSWPQVNRFRIQLSAGACVRVSGLSPLGLRYPDRRNREQSDGYFPSVMLTSKPKLEALHHVVAFLVVPAQFSKALTVLYPRPVPPVSSGMEVLAPDLFWPFVPLPSASLRASLPWNAHLGRQEKMETWGGVMHRKVSQSLCPHPRAARRCRSRLGFFHPRPPLTRHIKPNEMPRKLLQTNEGTPRHSTQKCTPLSPDFPFCRFSRPLSGRLRPRGLEWLMTAAGTARPTAHLPE
jgi:hypothetical protein